MINSHAPPIAFCPLVPEQQDSGVRGSNSPVLVELLCQLYAAWANQASESSSYPVVTAVRVHPSGPVPLSWIQPSPCPAPQPSSGTAAPVLPVVVMGVPRAGVGGRPLPVPAAVVQPPPASLHAGAPCSASASAQGPQTGQLLTPESAAMAPSFQHAKPLTAAGLRQAIAYASGVRARWAPVAASAGPTHGVAPAEQHHCVITHASNHGFAAPVRPLHSGGSNSTSSAGQTVTTEFLANASGDGASSIALVSSSSTTTTTSTRLGGRARTGTPTTLSPVNVRSGAVDPLPAPRWRRLRRGRVAAAQTGQVAAAVPPGGGGSAPRWRRLRRGRVAAAVPV
jgi:hypothetical protein